MKFSINQLLVVIFIAALALQIRRINKLADELKTWEELILLTRSQYREIVYDPEIEKTQQLSREIITNYRYPLDVPTVTARFEVLQTTEKSSDGQQSN